MTQLFQLEIISVVVDRPTNSDYGGDSLPQAKFKKAQRKIMIWNKSPQRVRVLLLR